MSTRQKVLWLVAAGVAGWSGWVLLNPAPQDDLVAAPTARSRPAPAPTRQTGARTSGPAGADVCIDTRLPVRAEVAEAAANPFQKLAPKASKAPPPPPVVVQAPPPPPPPPPPARPTLPYRYLGMLAERDGSDPRVFLMMGDKLIMARPGDVLEGGFRLDSIRPRELRFVRPSDNVTLKLSVEEGIAS
ncbi:MAG: hypothetical protein RJA44_1737 [Pseudomonadota bacterium]|jgi:hypothetical protein